MFFYMYAFIELLAFFLDSGVIPSAHVSYPVRGLVILSNKKKTMILNVSFSLLVVRRNLYRARGGDVHLSADQWLCRVPVCRGRDTAVVMGMHPRPTGEIDLRFTWRLFFITLVLADLLPGGIRCRLFPRHRHLQAIRRVQLF